MRARGHRRPAFVLGLIALLALSIGPVGVAASLAGAGKHASPATGHAEVIAHGVSAMPDSRIAWKVSQQNAKSVADEGLNAYPLGFAYAVNDPIVVNDYDTGAQTELAPGEAIFIAGGATQQHASLGAGTATYTQIALVSESAAPNQGNVFNAPSGNRAINLVRDVLTSGESMSMPDSGAPALVYVSAGSVKATSSSGDQSLKAGAAAVLSGDLTITQTGSSDATVVIASIGDDVPAAPRFSGTITLEIFGCPAGTTVKSLPAAGAGGDNPCQAIEIGVELTLKSSDGKDRTLKDADPVKGQPGAYRWSLLPFGGYEIQTPSKLPAGYGQTIFVGADESILDTAAATLSRANPDVTIALYLMTGATGKITARVIDCPPGITAETVSALICTNPSLEPVEITLSSPALTNGDLTVKDTVPDNSSYIWNKLPLSTNGNDGATYAIAETKLPAGYDSYVIDGAKNGGNGAWTVDLSSTSPEATLTIYNIQSMATSGTITLDVVVCPSASSANDQCVRPQQGPAGLTGIMIAGGATLTETDAVQGNGSPFVWTHLAFTDYSLTTGDLVPPSGFVIAKVETTDGGDPSAGFSLSTANPIVNIVVFLAPSNGSATPVAQS